MVNSLTTLSLFCGKDHFSKVSRSFNYTPFSIDKRRRRGICEPDLRLDINNLSRSLIPFPKINVVWCAFPCQTFSYAAGSFYYKNGTPSASALESIKLLQKTLSFIKECMPVFYFIENPRGRLRYNKYLVDFLAATGGRCVSITLSSYGFPTTKPTDIFTNFLDWHPKERHSYGRGAKVTGYSLDNMTTCSRQETPEQLFEEIFKALSSYYLSKPPPSLL